MSHTVKRQSQLVDRAIIEKAVSRIDGAKVLGVGTVKMYSSSATGLRVQLPGWKYPLVIEEATGELKFDTYKGQWGDEKYLQDLQQGYPIELAKSIHEPQGHKITELPLENGDIRVTIKVGGGYAVDGGDSPGPSAGGYGVAGPGGE